MAVQSVLNAHQANTSSIKARTHVKIAKLVDFHRQVVLRFVNRVHSAGIKKMQAVPRVFVVYQANTNPKKEMELVKYVIQVDI
jgi:hypothetical protein